MMISNNNNFNVSSPKPAAKPSFKGYDARKLDSVVITNAGDKDSFTLFEQIEDIGKKNGFKVFFANIEGKLKQLKNSLSEIPASNCWAQDNAVLSPKGRVIFNRNEPELGAAVAKYTNSKPMSSPRSLAGTNVFFVKNNGKEMMLVGSKDYKKFDNYTLQLMTDIDIENIKSVPQEDISIDLLIRPLKNGKVLISDDSMTVKALKIALKNTKDLLERTYDREEKNKYRDVAKKLENTVERFEEDISWNRGGNPAALERRLKDIGLTPIRVPGARLYETIPGLEYDDMVHSSNHLNAIVHEKDNGDLVYITGKSCLNEFHGITPKIAEKINFTFEKMFEDALLPYVKKENIHFITTPNGKIYDTLTNDNSSVHTLALEIPVESIKKP